MKTNAGRDITAARVESTCDALGLEREPESDLHDARSTLNSRQVSEAWIPRRRKRIDSLNETIHGS
jgi:hypothetical protein